ncbi:AMP-binding enzyme [Aspergillus flavus AF70]|nr:AMP-binding enzyme [Aspergillus flavus AF70]
MRSKDGCLTCRRRKKKCDERHPTCTGCHRNHLTCQWPTTEVAVRMRRPRRRQVLSDMTIPPELAAMVTVFAVPSPGLVRRLLDHFAKHGPMWLTSRMGNRRTAILSHIFPEAMESPLILHCVLMIAAKDLLKYDSNVGLQASAVEYYGRAISGLREALSGEQLANEPTSDHNLLAVALFCLHESQNYCHNDQILPHLNAAAALLRPRLHLVPPNSSLRKFLVEMFCYFFSITAFTHSVHLSLSEARQIFEFPGLLEHLQSGSIMGTSQKVFFILFRVALQLSQVEPTTFSNRRIYRDIVSAERDLRDNRASFQIFPDMSAETINDGVTFELYRLACVIFLQSLIDESITIFAPPIQEMVSSFVTHLSMLPPESPSDGFLFPTDITIWKWLFDSRYSPLNSNNPDKLGAFVNAATKERIRYDALKEYTTHVSTALVRNYGLQPGDTVALFSPNTIWYPVAMLAAVRAIISGASPAYNIEEMTYALKTGNAKFLMTVPAGMDVAVPAAREAGIPTERIFLLEGEKGEYISVQDLVRKGRSYGPTGQTTPFELPRGKSNRDVCGFLSFSSGTTGLPKAVMIAHHNVIAQCMQVDQILRKDVNKSLAVLPLFHITGLVHQMHLPVIRNSTVYMLPSFTMESMLATIVEYQITEILSVPPIIIRLLTDPIVSKYDLSHVKTFSSGAAPISGEILQKLEARFPWTGFKQGYGMTESCSCITAHPPEKQTYEYAQRAGILVANTEVKILNTQNGKELGYGEEGEILARGPQVVMGYLGNEKATRETFDSDGWLHTGDVGYMDQEGFLVITDRIKEMIKVKGIGVSPAELEDLLLGHPEVDDAAVTSVPDDYSGEKPKAYVVVNAAAKSRLATGDAVKSVGRELIEYVKAKKVRHKWIVEVEFMDEIPKSPSGKILRRVLRDRERKRESGEKRLVVRDEKATAKL